MGFKKEEKKVVKPLEEENGVIQSDENEEEVEEIVPLIDDNDAKDIVNAINAEKDEFLKVQKKWRMLGLIGTGVFLIFMVAGFILCATFVKNTTNQWVSYIGFGLIVIGFVISIIISKVQKSKVSAAATKYADFYYEKKAQLVFNIPGISNVEASGKFENKESFINAKFYKDIKTVRSRFGVKFKYNKKDCAISETAGCVLIKNRTSPKFLGKFFVCPIKYEKPTTILFQLKGKELSQPIDNIQNLELKEGNDKYVIYSNDDEYNEVLTSKVIGLIKAFKIKDPVIDVIVSIHENELSIGIDYIDEYMNAPIDKDLDLERISKEKLDIERLLAIVKEFN